MPRLETEVLALDVELSNKMLFRGTWYFVRIQATVGVLTRTTMSQTRPYQIFQASHVPWNTGRDDLMRCDSKHALYKHESLHNENTMIYHGFLKYKRSKETNKQEANPCFAHAEHGSCIPRLQCHANRNTDKQTRTAGHALANDAFHNLNPSTHAAAAAAFLALFSSYELK